MSYSATHRQQGMTVICLVTALLAAGAVSASSWTYQDQRHWAPTCQKGHHQSPVALSEDIARERHFHQFRLHGYERIVPAVLMNNGHSAEVRLDISQEKMPEISGGGLSGTYKLDHLHFHWKSEHTLEGRRFPLELHLVHYGKEYGTLTEAVSHPQGVAVFAVMFDLSPDDDEEFEPLLNIISTLQNKINTAVPLQQFIVKNFVPRDVAGFYRYEGSLTTPNCNEGILWTIFTNTIPISARQVTIFENLHADNHTVLKQNYRSIQPLNDREVFVKISPIRSGARMPATPTMLLMALLTLTFGVSKM